MFAAKLRAHAGTTSACAENTNPGHRTAIRLWNYLRVRGEYSKGAGQIRVRLELPPRARRIHALSAAGFAALGTTSACAENTSPPPSQHSKPRNYLRVRGEYPVRFLWVCGAWELPPRARRILASQSSATDPRGTTSACAENTRSRAGRDYSHGNYLRVRGEYTAVCTDLPLELELPPRARRIP